MLAAGTAAGQATRSHRSNAILGLVFGVAAISVPCFAYLGDGIPAGAPSGALWATLALLVYSASRLVGLIMGTRLLLIAGIFWLFMYVSFSVVPLAQMDTGLYPGLRSKAYLSAAQVMALLVAVAFDLGRRIEWLPREGFGGSSARPPRELSLPRLQLLTVAAFVMSAYYISTTGLATLFSSRQELGDSLLAAGLRSSGSQVGSAFVVMFGTVPALVCLIGWTLHLVRRKKPPTLSLGLIWLGLLAVNVAVNNPISNARYWALTVLAAIAFSMPWFSPRAFRVTLIGGVLAALILFPYSDRFRYADAPQQAVVYESISEALSVKDYDQSIMTANGIWYVQNVGHSFGRQLLGDVMFAVPRAVWPDKPIDTGVLIGQALNSSNTNLSSPLFLELYVDFGWLGMAVGMAVIGWACGRGDELFACHVDRFRHRVYGVDLLMPLLAGYCFILLRGPLLQSMSRLAVIVACCAFLAVRASVSSSERPTPAAGAAESDRPSARGLRPLGGPRPRR